MKISEKRNRLFAGITFVVCLLLFCKRLTGEGCHAILGMLLMSISAVHVWRHIGKLKYKRRSVQITDWVMLVSLVTALFSGILLHVLQDTVMLLILHKVSAVLLGIGMIVHVIQGVTARQGFGSKGGKESKV